MAFCVEDGYNTSYIDSALIALFYKPTHLYELLTEIPEDIKFVYLQEIILSNFVEQIRKNYSISSTYINEIRNYSIMCGWKYGYSITDLYDVQDYLTFLLKGLNSYPMTIETMSSKIVQINCITLNLFEDSTLKKLLNDWIESTTDGIQYKFVDLPQLITIYIDRKKEGTKIDIMKKIQFAKNNTHNNASWIIHSLICKTKSHYYAVVYTLYGNWYLFDNNKLPSILQIDITNNDISEKIKQECVIVLYRIDDILCNI